MHRESVFYIRLILLFVVFILGTTACGFKFGAEARQAAENARKNKAVFVDVDNTQPEPVVKQGKIPVPEKSEKQSTGESAKGAARYVRIGKHRRLKSTPIKVASDSKQAAKLKIKNGKSTHSTQSKTKPLKRARQKVLYPTVQLYGAKLTQSEWLVSSTEMECFLTQRIPRLGKAKFIFNPVQHLRFVFEVGYPVARKLQDKDKRYSRALITDVYPYPHVGAKLESIP
ncbi:hypothetical protein JYT31_03475, partial [Beggiatoa alba]|nr:hypothetical protein [Beggiatoa alba]